MKYNSCKFPFYFSKTEKQSSKSSSALPPDTPELSEAELRFLREQMGDTDSECKNPDINSNINIVLSFFMHLFFINGTL